jgi:uncharacterized protein (DUF2336 family)
MNVSIALVQEIEQAIAVSSVERRAAMTRHLTDLFLCNSDIYSDDEIALFDDIFTRLSLAIEESSRALLAMRLAPVPKAPAKILRALACDDAIDVASSVLIQSECLDEPTLVECAKTKSQEHLLAISLRTKLGQAVTDVLVDRGDSQVVLSTAENAGAKFSDDGFAILVKRANADDRLAECVGSLPDLPEQLFLQLLSDASAAVRSKLEAEHPRHQRDVRSVVAEVTARIEDRAALRSSKYATAEVLVESLNRAGQLNGVQLETFARENRFEEIVAGLAIMSGVPTDIVARKLTDEFAAFLLVLSKAIDLPWKCTQTLVEFGVKTHRCSAKELDNSVIDFQHLKRQTAFQILWTYRPQKVN